MGSIEMIQLKIAVCKYHDLASLPRKSGHDWRRSPLGLSEVQTKEQYISKKSEDRNRNTPRDFLLLQNQNRDRNGATPSMWFASNKIYFGQSQKIWGLGYRV